MTSIPRHFIMACYFFAGLQFSHLLFSAETLSKEDYESGKARVLETYQKAKADCIHYTGNKNEVCLQEAEAKKNIGMADLEAQLKGSPAARNTAEMEKVEANYNVAKQLCEDMIEQDTKAMCNARAKAERDSGINEIAHDRKGDAKRAVSDSKQEADYAAEIKKCDNLPGGARSLCRENTRKLYGKS